MVERELACPDCGGAMYLKEAVGNVRARYLCDSYPECRGAHAAKRDAEPLGIPANAETRAARVEAHNALARIEALVGRGRAYRWLATVLKLDQEECHIAQFDLAMCKRVVGAVNTYTRG